MLNFLSTTGQVAVWWIIVVNTIIAISGLISIIVGLFLPIQMCSFLGIEFPFCYSGAELFLVGLIVIIKAFVCFLSAVLIIEKRRRLWGGIILGIIVAIEIAQIIDPHCIPELPFIVPSTGLVLDLPPFLLLLFGRKKKET